MIYMRNHMKKIAKWVQDNVQTCEEYVTVSLQVVLVTGSLDDLLKKAEEKLKLSDANAIYTSKGGLVDDIDLIR